MESSIIWSKKFHFKIQKRLSARDRSANDVDDMDNDRDPVESDAIFLQTKSIYLLHLFQYLYSFAGGFCCVPCKSACKQDELNAAKKD